MLATFTIPTIYNVRRDLVPLSKITTHNVLVNKFFGQPDDGLHVGPKHVVVYYISPLIVLWLCSWLYVYIDIYIYTHTHTHTTAFYYWYPSYFNLLTSNDHYSGRTASLTSKRCILYIYSTNIGTEYFKHGIILRFFLFKMQFVSQFQRIWFLYYSHFIYRVC
jgi:hypothetical protein